MPTRTITSLPDLGVLLVAGPDSRRFLQGQLSNDLDRLDAAPGLRAGLHTPQGRVIAVLQLLPAGEDVLLVLPRELAPVVASHLRRYILRAKVRIEDLSDRQPVCGIEAGNVRILTATPATDAAAPDRTGSAEAWHARDIALGLPQVYAATSGTFIAQMLNLDHVEGISFTKGCYTGQEIIARAHYRGRVKRRAQRFRTGAAVPLSPGDRVVFVDGRTAEVVDVAAPVATMREFLAVTALPGSTEEPSPADPALPRIDAEALPLPYALESDAG
ncbi:MAG: hypothetical protein RLZZ393_319 [Pseudomonadota bacterium]|jgi:folate-binding protein YgfZ